MVKLISDKISTEPQDFSHIKNSKYFIDPDFIKNLTIQNARGSSYIEGINLPEKFFEKSYDTTELDDSNNE